MVVRLREILSYLFYPSTSDAICLLAYFRTAVQLAQWSLLIILDLLRS